MRRIAEPAGSTQQQSDKVKAIAVLVLCAAAMCQVRAQVLVLDVEAKGVVRETETLADVRAALERSLRKSAIQNAPTVVEWDRTLKDEQYAERVSELALGMVTLENVRQSVTVSEGGAVEVTVRARARVETGEMTRWADRLDETERLRADLVDARRSASAGLLRRGAEGDRKAFAPAASTSSVRMRLGDAEQLSELAAQSGSEARRRARASVLELLSSAVVQVSGVQVDSQQNWRKFAFGMSWKLPGMARFAEDLGAAVAFEAFRGQEYVGFGVDAASQPESPGARELRRELVNSKVSIEIRLGQQTRLVPVAFKVSHFDTRWADDCSKHYVSGGTGDRDLLLDKTGWCLLQQGDSTLQDEVKKAATLWLRPDAVSGAVGPTMSWHVRWPDGTTVRAPAVTQYVAHK